MSDEDPLADAESGDAEDSLAGAAADPQACAEPGPPKVVIQGGMVGDDNIQLNWFKERELDARRVDHLSAHNAARYVAALNAEDAAFVLALADPAASARVLRVLLAKEKELVMEILPTMNRDKADELLNAIGPDAAGLARLPEAAEAIANLEDAMPSGQELGRRSGPLGLAAASRRGTQGFYQNFTRGQIHWSERAGAQPTRGAIGAYYLARHGTHSRLGFPLTAELPAGRSPFGTDGCYQRFEFTRSYRPSTCSILGIECGATVYWCEQYGAHATWGGIGEHYERQQGTVGPLGFPVDEEVKAGPSERSSGPGTVGWRQRFEGGVVYYSEKTKAVVVPAAVAAHHDKHGGVTGPLGFPVSSEFPAAESPFGTTGRIQRFEAMWDYPEDITAAWADFTGPAGATVYVSEAHGVHCVGWGNGQLHEKLGGAGGWLGYPRSDETDARASESEPWCTIQEFEGGAIFYKEGHGSVPVPGATLEFITSRDGLQEKLGFPVTAENVLTGGTTPGHHPGTANPAADREQFFEHGVVTVRNGVMEAWLRAPL